MSKKDGTNKITGNDDSKGENDGMVKMSWIKLFLIRVQCAGVVCVNCTCALVPCKLASSSPSNNKFQSNIALYLYLTRKSLKPTALEAPPLYKNNFKLYSGSSTVALGKPMGSMARTIRDANLNKLSTYSSSSSPGSQGTCLLPRLKLPSEGLVTASFQ
uniref:Uncharacterized protein n=1 Tax=Tetranychus urticae TaxID=32264 RepID=A0A158P525_TETUR